MEKKLNFTDQALNQINKIAVGKDKRYFRITVQGGGCSGFKYSFGFDSKTNEDDIKRYIDYSNEDSKLEFGLAPSFASSTNLPVVFS